MVRRAHDWITMMMYSNPAIACFFIDTTTYTRFLLRLLTYSPTDVMRSSSASITRSNNYPPATYLITAAIFFFSLFMHTFNSYHTVVFIVSFIHR